MTAAGPSTNPPGTAAIGGDAHGAPEALSSNRFQQQAVGPCISWRDEGHGAGTTHAAPVVAPVTHCHMTP